MNRIYDWADENGVKIDTGVKPEIQNDENIQNDEPQSQNNDTIQWNIWKHMKILTDK